MPTGFKTTTVRRVEARRVRFAKTEAKGTIDVQTRWTDKQAHPVNMNRYEQTLNDPEVNIAINLLSDMIAPSYYTEMPEEFQKKKPEDPDHKHKQTIDKYGEDVNLDEDLQTIVRIMLGKGFSPVERLANYDLKMLPPEGFYIWKTKKGQVYRYTQEVSSGEVARWENSNWKEALQNAKPYYKKEEFKQLIDEQKDSSGTLDDIILFINLEDPSHPYGKALVNPIVDLIEDRKQTITDINRCIHRYGTPRGIMWTKAGRETIQKEFTDLEPDEWLFIGNLLKDEMGFDIIQPEMRQSWVPYVELTYYLIAEALHAPLLLYLKNATEASANVMMEAVDRYIQGRQRYVKRRVERFLFEPQCGEPVPRLVWGQPKTGLEEIELTDIANLYASGAIKFNQVQDLLKKHGIDLPEPEEEVSPPPEKQFEKPMPPVEAILDKMNDLGTALNIIEANCNEKKISLVKAMKMGHKAIDVHCKRMFPKHDGLFKQRREQQYEQWGKRLFKVKEKKAPTYTVTVDD